MKASSWSTIPDTSELPNILFPEDSLLLIFGLPCVLFRFGAYSTFQEKVVNKILAHPEFSSIMEE